MCERLPVGVVTQEGDRFVGRCDELGTSSVGNTVAEAFANLRLATWLCAGPADESARGKGAATD